MDSAVKPRTVRNAVAHPTRLQAAATDEAALNLPSTPGLTGGTQIRLDSFEAGRK